MLDVTCCVKCMAKIAVIKTGGKQYKVAEDQIIKVEKLPAAIGAAVKLETLLISDEAAKDLTVGTPSLGAKVEAQILRQDKADKVSVIKFKNKTRYKRNVGHRQPFSEIKITNIT